MSTMEVLAGPVLALGALAVLVAVSPPADRKWVALHALKVVSVGASLFGLAIVAGWL